MITKKKIKQALTEAMQSIDFKKFHSDDPNAKQGVVGTQDAADHYGTLNDEDNVLDYLDDLKLMFVRNDDREAAQKVAKAGQAIEKGDLGLADKILVPMFNQGGKYRSVYHAIAYVRDKLKMEIKKHNGKIL